MPARRQAAPPVDRLPSRARGALWGLCLGDALGTPLQGRRLWAPDFPALCEPVHTGLRGGGVLGVKPGQVSAPTQLAACVAASLRMLRVFDPEDVRRRYQALLPVGLGVGPFLQSVLTLTPVHVASRTAWLQSGRRAAGAQALARAVPLGVFYARSEEERVRTALEDCALTHFHPSCQLASAAVAGALGTALTAPAEPKPEAVLEGARAALRLGATQLSRVLPELVHDIQAAVEALRADLSAAEQADPELYGPELHLHQQEDSVRVPLRLAFWELVHAPSLEAGLVDATHRGGDAATNGALAGALLGARFGEEALPSELKAAVGEALPFERGPLRTLYHPEQLVLLAESGLWSD